MGRKKITLVSSLQNTFVVKDKLLLEQLGYKVLSIQSPPHRDFIRFFWNRIRELVLSFRYVSKSEAVYSWFNDYHSTAALFWAKCFKKPSVILVGGYDAVSSKKLGYGIFLKKNLRQRLARWNYTNASEIWVVHKSLSEGCSAAAKQDGTRSGILNFLPDLKTPIREIPTGYDPTFWQKEGTKKSKTILTVANIADSRTYERKGIPLFIALAKALPDYEFTIAGIQTDRSGLDVLPNNIRLLGTLDRNGLKKQYSTHQFYFQGSQVEGLPNVLCEAMLCECIPIGNTVFGIPDAIGSTGHLFEGAKDLDSVLAFLNNLEHKTTSAMGQQARARIQKHVPISRRIQAFENQLNAFSNGM